MIAENLRNIFDDVFLKAPAYAIALEIFLTFSVVWLFTYKGKSKGHKLTAEEEKEIITNFKPEPLIPDVPIDHPALSPRIVVHGTTDKTINIDGIECLNLATHNYLGFANDELIKESAILSLRKYGVGSCGPRGFYGTVDVHLELEENLAKFMNYEECIIYSYAFSTIASTIPAYSKRFDIIFTDECVNFAIQKSLDASRSQIIYFKHNDMKDLENKLEEQEKLDVKNPKKAARTRKFLVVEGIYMNTGEMCDLKNLIKLRKKYKLRLFLDESISFGTIGKTGKGITEYYDIDHTEVDLISGSLEWAVGSIGGFCVGSSFIIEHQRLSGIGYCFSASLPPLLAQASISALKRFQTNPEIFKQLNENAEKVHVQFRKLSKLMIRGHYQSPVKHLYLKKKNKDFREERKLLRCLSDRCIELKVAIILPEYLEDVEKKQPRPSIRLTVNRFLDEEDIKTAFRVIEDESRKLF